MASSLSPSCNASKQSFDTCFNTWFKSYLLLVSPPLINPIETKAGIEERRTRDQLIRKKKVEYENSCGRVWKEYDSCLKSAIPTKEGLSEMLEQARKEEPLHGWGGIKVATQEDLQQP